MAANMMPLLMMCSMSVSSSSSSGLVVAPIVIFFNVIMGFFRTLMNPLGAGKKLIKAPLISRRRVSEALGDLLQKDDKLSVELGVDLRECSEDLVSESEGLDSVSPLKPPFNLKMVRL